MSDPKTCDICGFKLTDDNTSYEDRICDECYEDEENENEEYDA